MVTASVEVQTLLLDANEENQHVTAATNQEAETQSGELPAVVAELTPVRFLLTVGPTVSEQRAAVNGGI